MAHPWKLILTSVALIGLCPLGALAAQINNQTNDPFANIAPESSLNDARGGSAASSKANGTPASVSMGDEITQSNQTSQTASNSGGITVSGQTASISTGSLSGNTFTGNSGISTLMMNSGNEANLTNSLSVIVNLH